MPSLLLIKAVYCLGSKSMLGALWNWHSLSRRIHSMPAAQDSAPLCFRFHSFCDVYFLFGSMHPTPPTHHPSHPRPHAWGPPPSPALAYVCNNLTFTFDLLTADWRCLKRARTTLPVLRRWLTQQRPVQCTNNKACFPGDVFGCVEALNSEQYPKGCLPHSVTNQWHNQSMQIQPDSRVKITTGSHDYSGPNDLVCLKLIM